MTWDHRVIWCGVGRSNAGYGALWALRIKSETPRCALTTPHPPLLGQVPTYSSGVLLLTGSQADYVLITPAEEREGEWEGSSRLAPQACRLPRPQHCTNESRGSGWAHTGGQGLLPRAKRSQRERPKETLRRPQQGLLKRTCSLRVLDLKLLLLFLCEDGPPQFGLSAGACL